MSGAVRTRAPVPGWFRRHSGDNSRGAAKAMIERIALVLLLSSVTACLPSNSVLISKGKDRAGLHEHAGYIPPEPSAPAKRSTLKVMTFNIRWEGFDNNGNFIASGFMHRKPLVLDVLSKFDADIIGLQEASIEQRAVIARELPAFDMFPPPSAVGDECILYRPERFTPMDRAREYLRRVPEIPGTNIGVRDFVWIHLQDQFSGKRFYVINLHMDHRSSIRGRQLDAVLIGEWIRKRAYDDPVILLGDFNGTPDNPRYLYVTGRKSYPGQDGVIDSIPVPMLDTFRVANPDAHFTGTTNSGYRGVKNNNQIDYVFVPHGTRVLDSRIIYYHVNGSYPSDHFPLLSEIELQ
jgi:endonuclease/exonuclease/phosphatase family metal-dependent hydrolase